MKNIKNKFWLRAKKNIAGGNSMISKQGSTSPVNTFLARIIGTEKLQKYLSAKYVLSDFNSSGIYLRRAENPLIFRQIPQKMRSASARS